MKSKTTTDEDQLIHFEQINLQEVGTDRDATEESKYERERIDNELLKSSSQANDKTEKSARSSEHTSFGSS